jgi:hypothetical protein
MRTERLSYHNAVLTAIAVFLGLLVLDRYTSVDAGGSEALAQSSPPQMVSAAEQRKQIIQELKQISTRLQRLESRLDREMSVKVTDMPEIKIPATRD